MPDLKKYVVCLVLVIAMYKDAAAQNIPDSVIRNYERAKTTKEKLYSLYDYIDLLRRDSSFLSRAIPLINFLESVDDRRSRDLIQLSINDHLSKTGDYANALASTLDITNRFELTKDTQGILAAYRQLSSGYYYAGDRENDLVYGKKSFEIGKSQNNPIVLSSIANNISTSYSQKKNPDSALLYARLAVNYVKASGDIAEISGVLGTLAEAFIAGKQYDSALFYARESFKAFHLARPDDLSFVWTLNDLSQIFLARNQYDSVKHYAHKAAGLAGAAGFQDQLQRAYEYLSRAFEKTNQPDSAFKYLQSAVAIKDLLYDSDKTKSVNAIMAREQARIQEREKDRLDFKNKTRLYGLFSGLLVLGIIALMLYRNNRQKQKANGILEATLRNLKATQSQLIQSEKMASLGELTAGIAHEIQNPLNFVNNFSEINKELLEEVKSQKSKLKTGELDELLKDIVSNEAKINHHGKRADAIVKGMLQHSRTSKGIKESTDINALADEYLRLAYHGIRAKDHSFNVVLKTDFDTDIGKINIIPQDMGRVVLNLVINAFHAVDEKKKSGVTGYEPQVSLGSKKDNGNVVLTVEDNGKGIPAAIVDKIFQPFFTTKPTGQGTGLGLSLAYDIVKSHGGHLDVSTQEGRGTIFTISLPANQHP